ncbi:MAG: T9SS type A sorting domain-containing protein, partial [Fimbriimonadaceae bacterium]|nr:T9SS type A sorting domain-containing protein [Chitinophagales bacterium]
TINISHLAKGLYFIEITDNTGSIIKTLKVTKD